MTRTRRLGDYELGGIVGHGLVGVIYEGTFVPGSRSVVLEEIPAELAADADFRKRLAAAGKVATELHSPHVVGTYNLVAIDSDLFVVSELPGGPTLASVVAAKPLTPAGAVAVACDVLDGLAAVHSAGLHHGDVNAATTFITPAGEARIGEVAVAAARTPTSTADDLRAVTTLLSGLMADNAMPLRLAAALARAPGQGHATPHTDAAGFGAALVDAAVSVFGPDWRRTTGLGERARSAPAGAAAIDLAAVTPTPPPADSKPVAAPAPLTPAPPTKARRRRWPWLVLALAVLLAAGGGTAAYLLSQSKPPVPGTGNGPQLGIGTDLAMSVTPASGGCDTTFGFVATATVSGSGDMTYRWERAGTALPPTETVHITTDDGSFKLTQAWRISGTRSMSGTMTFHILTPVDRQVAQSFTYACS